MLISINYVCIILIDIVMKSLSKLLIGLYLVSFNAYAKNSISTTETFLANSVEINEGNSTNEKIDVGPLNGLFAAGETCVEAVTAVSGTNHLPSTASGEYWYHYTMPSDGRLEITSATSNPVNLRKNCTWGPESYGTGNTTVNLNQGDDVYIRWEPNGGNFEWNFAVAANAIGEDCSDPIVATQGTNTIADNNSTNYYYTYTLTNDARLEVTSSTYKYIRAYLYNSGTCYSQWLGDGSGGGVFSASAGETILLEWYTPDDIGVSSK